VSCHIYFSLNTLYRPHPPASAFTFHLLTLNLAKAPGQFSVGTGGQFSIGAIN